MKLTLTKETLKQIIKEELQGVLSEDDKKYYLYDGGEKYDGRGMDKGFDTREEAEEARDSLPSYLSDLSIRQG